jgi:hypothetical protein
MSIYPKGMRQVLERYGKFLEQGKHFLIEHLPSGSLKDTPPLQAIRWPGAAPTLSTEWEADLLDRRRVHTFPSRSKTMVP